MKTLRNLIFFTGLLALGALPCHSSVTFAGTTWYSSSNTASTLTQTAGVMTLAAGNHAITYVTPTRILEVGDKLTLSVTFNYTTGTAASANGFRFGLFDSTNSRVSGDAGSSSLFTNYAGYVAAFGNNSTSTNAYGAGIWERTTPNSALINTSGQYSPNTTSNTAIGVAGTPPMQAGSDYTLTLTLDYLNATDMEVTSVLSGGGLPTGFLVTRTYTDVTPVTNIDTIVLFGTTSMSNSMSFQSVSLSVVPEPAGGALLGFSLLVLFGLTRRRSR